jgi:hypothetical protein
LCKEKPDGGQCKSLQHSIHRSVPLYIAIERGYLRNETAKT